MVLCHLQDYHRTWNKSGVSGHPVGRKTPDAPVALDILGPTCDALQQVQGCRIVSSLEATTGTFPREPNVEGAECSSKECSSKMESKDKRSRSEKRFDNAERLHSLRVLVVEDHPDTLRALEMFLKALGHRPELAQNMQEALRLGCGENEKFDLLLSDLRLPDGNGWELLLQLRERGCAPERAIALSGWSSKEDFMRSKAAGFEVHLIKPFTPGILEAALLQKNGPVIGPSTK
jgi:CheY-like chemotaxis protein